MPLSKNPTPAVTNCPNLLIILAIASVAVGFVLESFVGGNAATYRTNNTVEIAGRLQNARL